MKWNAALTAALLTATPAIAWAHTEPFGYVRGAQSAARGEWEVEQWVTTRIQKLDGDYLGLDVSTELEYGITDRLQVAAYLNTQYHYIRNATGGTKVFDDVDQFDYDGISGEIKYQLCNPFTESWGLSLYFEPGYGRIDPNAGDREDRIFLEFKGIVERHFLDHRLIAAFNYTIEPEWESEPGGEWETALEMEWALGVCYQVAPGWRVGVEGRLLTEFEEADLNRSEFSTFGLGPTIQYAGESWYTTLTILPQVTGWPDAPGSGGRNLDHGEVLAVRLKFGFEF